MQGDLEEEDQSAERGASSFRPHDSRMVRILYLTLGIASLVLAVLGVVLPVLPTTPFILLAAACFARMLSNRFAGPIIREWREHRSIPLRIKRWIYLMMVISFGSSILFLPQPWQQLMMAILGIILLIFIWRIPVRDMGDGHKAD